MSASDDLHALFRSLPSPYVVLTPDLVVVDVTDIWADTVGRVRPSVVGHKLFDAFPPSPGETDEDGVPFVQKSLERARDERTITRLPLTRYDIREAASGAMRTRWWSLVHFPIFDADGRCVLIGQLTEDVTDLVHEQGRNEVLLRRARSAQDDLDRQAERLTAALRAEETAVRRMRSLAELSLALGSAPSIDELPAVIGRSADVLGAAYVALTVPGRAGGWVTLTPDGPEADREVPYDSPLPGPHVGRTGTPLLLLSKEAADAFAPDVMRDVVVSSRCVAGVFLPVRTGRDLLGVFSVCWATERTLTAEELALLDGFAAQLATALERIRAAEVERRLTRRAQRLSESLQRSLLTTPIAHERLDIAVRYLPAAEEAQIGGDWYDAFTSRSGRTLLVVGDVSGHDRTAAAMMGQVRNLLRGLAYDSDDGPAALLSRLDRALHGLDLETLATCVVLDAEFSGSGCRIRWSNAGHLEPLLRLPDGEVTRLGTDADLLLGLDPGTERHEGRLEIAAGATLVLCTDGLVERRTASLEEGYDRLAAAVRNGPTANASALCDHVLTALDDGRSDDDVALLVARILPC